MVLYSFVVVVDRSPWMILYKMSGFFAGSGEPQAVIVSLSLICMLFCPLNSSEKFLSEVLEQICY